MDEIKAILGRMEPREAARSLASAAKDLFPMLEEDEQRVFLESMLGEPGGDKVVGMVHL
jgi:hypothetical protein